MVPVNTPFIYMCGKIYTDFHCMLPARTLYLGRLRIGLISARLDI